MSLYESAPVCAENCAGNIRSVKKVNLLYNGRLLSSGVFTSFACAMCGLTGFVSCGPVDEQELRAQVCHMADQLIHRGPDDWGAWVDGEAGVALALRRLAIVDLSPAGHQPMVSSCGRYVMVFNGEVYNAPGLRRELEPCGRTFRGHSDTEAMLEAISEWGLDEAVKKFIGMFAIALWDRRDRVLHLVRDRLGIKPLYYGWCEKTFVFASELKALRAHPAFVADVNRDALALEMRHAYIPQPYSIYRGILKLPPACRLTLKTRLNTKASLEGPTPYWSTREVVERGAADPWKGTEEAAVKKLDSLLRDAVRMRMVADVPLGAFLSGGIDSSTVVALMQAQSSRPVRTFTIGFREETYNEAAHARAVATHLGTEHTELYVTPREAVEVIPKLPTLYDEPFADASQIPTYLVSALTRRQVTVSLSGDGGDELFGGYPAYFRTRSLWTAFKWFPRSMRRLLAWVIVRWDPVTYNRYLRRLAPLLAGFGRSATVGEKAHKLAEALPVDSPYELYCHLTSFWKRPNELVLGAQAPPTIAGGPSSWASVDNLVQWMIFLDLVTYLPDDILAKVDRASMAVSLEARVPLLDHRVVEFAARVPVSLKMRGGQGKWLLRQVLYRYVPKELVERPKKGFAVPLDEWLRGPLRDWAEELLDEARLRREGYLRPEPVRALWREHLSGQRNRQDYLWNVLMFQAWRERWA